MVNPKRRYHEKLLPAIDESPAAIRIGDGAQMNGQSDLMRWLDTLFKIIAINLFDGI
jgi:hypothetical protein